jgi:sortase A
VLGLTTIGLYGWDYYKASQSVSEIPVTEEEETIDQETKVLAEAEEEETSSSVDSYWTEKYDYELGGEVATLDMPKINKRFTTYWGTDDGTLSQGVGMYISEWTTVPNKVGGHTVLSGHRDTVFVFLPELEEGDRLEVQFEGQTFVYEIESIWITHKDDRSVIVEKEDPTLTLTTCYPFDAIGDTEERYIIQSQLVE